MTGDTLYWYWLAAGVALMGMEMLLPGVALLWVGSAALATGVVAWLFPDMIWQWQVMVFGVLAIAVVLATRRIYGIGRPASTDEPTLNQTTNRMVGQLAILETAIEAGQGRAKIGDGSWVVSGEDMPVGTKVKIVSADGNLLKVEQVF